MAEVCNIDLSCEGFWRRAHSAFGADALRSTTTGGNNVAVGKRAGRSTTTGANNVAIGAFALTSNTTTSNTTSSYVCVHTTL